MHRLFVFVAIGLLALIAALSPTLATEYRAEDGRVAVIDPWTRATASAGGTGAGYMVIANEGEAADRLVAARSAAAETVEIHTHTMDGGVMRMRPVESIELPPGETVTLQPGGLHVMFIDTNGPFRPGAPVPLTLVFETAGEVELQLPVAPPGATQPPASPPASPSGATRPAN